MNTEDILIEVEIARSRPRLVSFLALIPITLAIVAGILAGWSLLLRNMYIREDLHLGYSEYYANKYILGCWPYICFGAVILYFVIVHLMLYSISARNARTKSYFEERRRRIEGEIIEGMLNIVICDLDEEAELASLLTMKKKAVESIAITEFIDALS